MEELLEKHAKNLRALIAGALVAVAMTWAVADTLYTKKIDILETALRATEKKLAEVQGKLEQTQLALEKTNAGAQRVQASLKLEQDQRNRRRQLTTLLALIDRDIQAKKEAMIMASPMSEDGRKGVLYLQAERELDALQARRNELLAQIIQLPAGQ